MRHSATLTVSKVLAPLALGTAISFTASGNDELIPDAGEIAAALAAGSGEQIYVLYGKTSETVYADTSPERVLELCNFMLKSGFDPEFPAFNVAYSAQVADLYSLQTQAARGRMVKKTVRKVGKSVACTGDETTDQVVIPGVYLDTTEFPNGGPSGRTNQAIEITVGRSTYYALGSGSIRTNPGPEGLPQPEFVLLTGSFTLHKVVDDPEPGWEVVGSYASNIAVPLRGVDADTDVSGGVGVLRASSYGAFVPRYILAGSN